MQHTNSSARQYYIDILRILLTFFVVLGHATYYNISTAFGGINYGIQLSDAGLRDSSVHVAMTVMTSWIYSFHMPVYFALSGLLFDTALKRNKYPTLVSLIKNKARRLLLPMILVWFFYNVPIKLLTGYYRNVPWTGILLQLIFPRNVYLWYLEALFCCFVLCYILVRYIKDDVHILLALIIAWVGGLTANTLLGNYVPFGNPLLYCIWLYTGMRLSRIRDWMISKNLWRKSVIALLFTIQMTIFVLLRKKVLHGRDIWDNSVFPLLMFIILTFVC